MPGSSGVAVLPVPLPELLPLKNRKGPVPKAEITGATSGSPVLPILLPVNDFEHGDGRNAR